MEQSRRDFIRTCGKVAAGLSLASLAGVQPSLKSGVPTAAACTGSGSPNWQYIRDNYFNLSSDYIYMNNSTMGATLVPVSDRMQEVQEIFSAGCTLDFFNTQIITYLSDVRLKMTEVINAPDALSPYGGYHGRWIGNTNSATEGLSLVANGVTFGPNDTILITDHEHTANEIPWVLQQDRYGANLVKIPLVENNYSEKNWSGKLVNRFALAISDSKKAGKPVKVISFPWVTTSTGHVLPAKALCKLASDNKIISVIDAAQAFTILPIDVRDLGCDFLIVNGHKYLCGPIGSGFLYMNPSRVTSFWGTIVDNTYYYGPHSASNSPHRKSGLSPYTNIIPLKEALEFYSDTTSTFAGLNKDIVFQRLFQIGEWLRSGLSAFPNNFTLITPNNPLGASIDVNSINRCVMTCFKVKGMHSEQVYETLKASPYKIQVKHSTEGFSLDAQGYWPPGSSPQTGGVISGAVRLAPHYYNTATEFNTLRNALFAIAGISGKNLDKAWPQFPG